MPGDPGPGTAIHGRDPLAGSAGPWSRGADLNPRGADLNPGSQSQISVPDRDRARGSGTRIENPGLCPDIYISMFMNHGPGPVWAHFTDFFQGFKTRPRVARVSSYPYQAPIYLRESHMFPLAPINPSNSYI